MFSFVRGLLTYLDALRFISERRLFKYFIYSGVIGLSIFAVFGGLIWSYSDQLSDWIVSLLPWDLSGYTQISRWIVGGLITVLALIPYKYLVLIATSPVMSLLSERVEYEMDDIPMSTDRSIARMVREVIRGMRIALRCFLREMMFTVGLLIIGLFPLVGVMISPLIFLLQGYYAGFGNHDFWAERHFSYRDTIRFMRSHRPMLAANGVIFLALLLIPVIGVIIAPPLATVAATLHGLTTLRREE